MFTWKLHTVFGLVLAFIATLASLQVVAGLPTSVEAETEQAPSNTEDSFALLFDDLATSPVPCGEESEKLSEIQRQKQEKSLKLVSALINLGKYEAAQKEFWDLENPIEQFEAIIQQTSQPDQPCEYYQEIDNIYNFIEANNGQQHKCALLGKVSNILIEKLNTSSTAEDYDCQDQSFKGVALAAILLECNNTTDSSNSNHSFDELAEKLSMKSVEEIRSWDFDPFIEFSKSKVTEALFKKYYGLIIQRTFAGNETGFDAVEELNLRLTNWNSKAFGWLTLLEQIEKTERGLHRGLTIKVAYRIWAELKENYAQIIKGPQGLETIGLYETAKSRIPEDIAMLFWGNRCTIKNAVTGEYLFASDKNETQVYLHKSEPNGNLRGWWKITPFVEDYPRHYVVHSSIKSLDWRRKTEYLSIQNPQLEFEHENKTQLLKGHVQTSYKTKPMSDIMSSWLLPPVVTSDGVEAFHMWTWNRDWVRFDLYAPGENRKNVVTNSKAMAMDAENTEERRNIHADEMAYKLKESYWQLACE